MPMNRFERSAPSLGRKITLVLSLVAFGLLLWLFLGGIRSLGDATADKQEESLKTALHRSITQCYAVEGCYPPDLKYLEEHYGLTFDEELFFVDYVSYGGNLFPEVTVLRKSN